MDDPEIWYLASSSGRVLGPFSETDIAEAMSDGDVTAQSLIWNPELVPDWKPIEQVPSLYRSVRCKQLVISTAELGRRSPSKREVTDSELSSPTTDEEAEDDDDDDDSASTSLISRSSLFSSAPASPLPPSTLARIHPKSPIFGGRDGGATDRATPIPKSARRIRRRRRRKSLSTPLPLSFGNHSNSVSMSLHSMSQSGSTPVPSTVFKVTVAPIKTKFKKSGPGSSRVGRTLSKASITSITPIPGTFGSAMTTPTGLTPLGMATPVTVSSFGVSAMSDDDSLVNELPPMDTSLLFIGRQKSGMSDGSSSTTPASSGMPSEWHMIGFSDPESESPAEFDDMLRD